MRDQDIEGPHRWDQLYLEQIRYVDYVDQAGDTQFLITVSFEYENRPDAFSDHRSGFEIRTRWRCKRILVRTYAGAEQSFRAFELSYQQDSYNSVSLLSEITVAGFDDNNQPSVELAPLKFGYTSFKPEKRRFISVTGGLPARSLAHADYELADLFGSGLPDILEMNGSVRYWRNLGRGQFDLPRSMPDAPAGVALASPGVQIIDANGDGRIDLVVTTNHQSGHFPLRFDGLWDRRSFQQYRFAPTFSLEDPEIKLVDLNGDGVTDAIRSGSRLECFFNNPVQGWTETRWVERQSLEEFPNINFSDPHVKWGDMTSDGLQDMVLIFDGNVEFWPNRGYGSWGKRVSMRNSPHFPYGYDPRRILVGDVDGDGAADIVYVDDTRVLLWINQSGNRWSDPIEITGTPPVSDMDAIRLIDLEGTGVSGILWSADSRDQMRHHMHFLDFTGGVKPYLLSEMDNQLGAVTKVEYAPSTHFYLEDQCAPETRWKTPLPFPVQVVARVEVIDALSGGKHTTEYRYHHGYWDGAEREFRGFGMVEQLDTETFERYNEPGLHGENVPFAVVTQPGHFAPPTLARTWFHQGPIGDEFGEWDEADYREEYWQGDLATLPQPTQAVTLLQSLPRRAKRDALRALRGYVLRTELYALDGSERQDRPYTVVESAYGLREESPPLAGESARRRIFFPHLVGQRTTQWERGSDPLTQFTFSGSYDAYGQACSQISIAVPRSRDYLATIPTTAPAPERYLATHTVTDYVQRDDPNCYIVNRSARITSYEIPNDGRATIWQLKQQIEAKTYNVPANVITQSVNFYDGDPAQTDGGAYVGLPFGQLGDYGALVRTEMLTLTEGIVRDAYRSGANVLTPPEEPPYMAQAGQPQWTADYPQAFRSQLAARAGYLYHSGGAAQPYVAGYYTLVEQRRYDFHDNAAGQGRGLIMATRDALGNESSVTYDAYDLLPASIADPAGLITSARYNYRTLQPMEITEPNGNQSSFTYTSMGMLAETWVAGRLGEGNGDQIRPSVRMEYDLLAFMREGQPIQVKTIRQVHHDTELDVPLPQRNETITTVEYSDGFGRVLQVRTQADELVFGTLPFGDQALPLDQSDPGGDAVGKVPASNKTCVIVSGWQVYDNKGRAVEKYEPFFATGWKYALPFQNQFGQKVSFRYNPRGQLIRMINPDGSEQRIIYGLPADLSDPDRFEPTPWQVTTYDSNDNAGRTHPADSVGYQSHWNTPSSKLLDALGREVEQITRNGTNPATDWYVTRSTYDIRGNLIKLVDPLGRVAIQQVFDLANRPLRVESIDAGIRRAILNAAGSVIETRDARGALTLTAYDVLNRPLEGWARDQSSEPVTLRRRLEYGEGGDPAQPAADRAANRQANRLGRLARDDDEAGSIRITAYDFKGNVLERERQIIDPAVFLSAFNPPPANWKIEAKAVDWRGGNAPSLDPTIYVTTLTYDALNRLKTMQFPEDVDGERKIKEFRYNRAGALVHVKLDGQAYVEHIAYNARGQRTLIAYGSVGGQGIMTRYAYDPQTFRLARLRTERYEIPTGTAATYQPADPTQPLQDIAYEYDLAGNLVALHDHILDCGLPSQPDSLDRAFTYDPFNRLLTATGREHNIRPPQPPWADAPMSQDITATRGYRESYSYDALGNLTALQHVAGSGSFTRTFSVPANSNRLQSMTIGGSTAAYRYDVNGNFIQENTERHFEWDHADRMMVFRNQTQGAEPSVYTRYLYDAGGQRVVKLVRKSSGNPEMTVYIDGLFEHHRIVKSGAPQHNNTLHVLDNQQRIATLRVGNPLPGSSEPNIKLKYHLGDHLGNSSVVVDDQGTWINREEYTPYGESSFGGFSRKRYRFTGKERDEESGLYYHGARYYAPWLARWTSPDPAAMVDGPNLYTAFRDNPLLYTDPSGMAADAGVDHDVNGTPASPAPPPNQAYEHDPIAGVTGNSFPTGKANVKCHSCDLIDESQLAPRPEPQRWDETWDNLTWGEFAQMTSRQQRQVIADIGGEYLAGRASVTKEVEFEWTPPWMTVPPIEVTQKLDIGSIEYSETMRANWTMLSAFLSMRGGVYVMPLGTGGSSLGGLRARGSLYEPHWNPAKAGHELEVIHMNQAGKVVGQSMETSGGMLSKFWKSKSFPLKMYLTHTEVKALAKVLPNLAEGDTLIFVGLKEVCKNGICSKMMHNTALGAKVDIYYYMLRDQELVD